MNTIFIVFALIISLIILLKLIVGVFNFIWSKTKKTEQGQYFSNKFFKKTPQYWIIVLITLNLTSCSTPSNEQESILSKENSSSISMQPSPSLSLPTETIQFTLTPLPKLINTEAVQPTQELINKNIMVAFIDVGQGDAILIRSPEGYYGLIDGGEENSGVLQYLQKEGVNNLDLIVATQPQSEHIGGLISILETIPTNRVVTNGEFHTTLTYENFLDAIHSSEAEYIEVVRGDQLLLGSLILDVLNPSFQLQDNLNENSLVLRMSFMNTTFLFMSDASYGTENEIMNSNVPLYAEILKVAHHGSNSSTSTGFVNIVKPSLAIYTAGLGNSFGYPHMETLNTLSTSGAKILGTDVNGTIVFIVDETGYSFDVEKEGLVKIQTSTPITTKTQTSTPIKTMTRTSTPITMSRTSTPITTITQTPTETLFIEVVSITSPIIAGSNANLVIKTTPGANCSIIVNLKSGASQADGLGDQIADATGKVSWTWKVGPKTTPGTWNIIVISSFNEESTSIDLPFEVK